MTSLKDIKEQIIKNKTDITEIDIAKEHQKTDNQKLKLTLLILISLKDIKEADKPPYQRASSESRQAHSHRIPSFPIAIP